MSEQTKTPQDGNDNTAVVEAAVKSPVAKSLSSSIPVPSGFRLGSHLVILKQVKGFSMLPKEGNIRDEVVKKVGSTFKKGTNDIIRGLSKAEEKEYLPAIIGINNTANEWEQTVRNYWANFTVSVPAVKGREMQIGFKEVNGKAVPIDIQGYMEYKFCVEHGRVAVTPEELENVDVYTFYIEDLAAVKDKEREQYSILKKANTEFVKITAGDNPQQRAKVEHILTVLAKDGAVTFMDPLDQEVELKKIVERRPQEFINLVEDPNLIDKALLQKLLHNQKVTIEGSSYFVADQRIGANYAEAVGWLADPNNSGMKSKLLEQLKSAVI